MADGADSTSNDPPKPAVLEFSGVQPADGGEGALDFVVRAGGLQVVEIPRMGDRPDVAGVATGMVRPLKGEVRVCGTGWSGLKAEAAMRLRRRIGRVFDARRGPVWLQNLDIEENTLLPHTFTGEEETEAIVARMRALAAEFGFDEMPRSRPSVTEPEVTQPAQCVRAFLRRELALLVLEMPLRGADEGLGELLRRKIEAFRAEGGAVLWVTDGSEPRDEVEAASPDGWERSGNCEWTSGGEPAQDLL